MSFENAHNTIRSRFKTQVADEESLNTQYDNVRFDPPTDAGWCRFSVQDGQSFQVSLGATKRFRHPGVATAQLFYPKNDGDKDILEMADKIRTAFESVTATGDTNVTFKTPTVGPGRRDGDMWTITVSCPFYWDDII